MPSGFIVDSSENIDTYRVHKFHNWSWKHKLYKKDTYIEKYKCLHDVWDITVFFRHA